MIFLGFCFRANYLELAGISVNKLLNRGDITVADQDPQRGFGGHPNRGVPIFSGGTVLPNRVGHIDVANLFGVKVILRHMGVSFVHGQLSGIGDAPTCFFKTFAVKRADYGFARVDPPTG